MTKVTKRSLLTSALALVVCVSMLIGTTYAWFTDSVTSANNIIKSGNLDIELEYWNGSEWATVEGASDVITNKNFEPGVTEVAYLRLANAGSLALKYQLGINIVSETEGKNAAGETFKLSDYVMFGVVEGVNGKTNPYANREAAVAALTESKKISAGYTKAASMNENDELYFALVVYMPETVDNVANHDGTNVPQINLGINVFATQQMAENDSFGDDYDVNATWIGIIPESLDETTLEIVPVDKAKTGTITINSAEDLVYLNKLAKEWVSLYSNGNGTSVTNYSVNNGGKGSDYYYHSQWTIELAADLDMNNIPMDSIDITYWGNFNGNGHTISNVVLNEGQIGLFNNAVKAISNLTVKNIVVTAPKANTVGAVANKGSMKNVHVENATVIGGKYVGGICGKGSSFINCSIKNSTVTGNDKTVGGLVGYSIGDPGTATVSGNVVENVTVTGTYNVGGLLGQSQNETVENNTVKNVTVKSTLELPGNASSNEVRTAEVAARSAFANTTIGTNTVENVTLVNVTNVSDNAGLNNAIASGKTEIALGSGNYTMPGTSGNVTISGTKDTVVTVTGLPGGSNVTINGVTVKGSGYATGINAATVTYNDATIIGEMCLYREKVVFNNCTFELNNQYIWTYGAKEVVFNNCTFNTNGKAILIYNESPNLVTNVTVTGCTFNASAAAYAGTISNQACAAIEIGSNLATNGHYTLTTSDNTVDADFSGEWRIKASAGSNVTVNGTSYEAVTLDGVAYVLNGKEVTVK